jgi:hypothetical protein
VVYIPLGNEFRVNSQTFATQDEPDVAVLTTGGFVVIWEDQSGTLGDSSPLSIKAQIYDSASAPVGGEFLINTQTSASQILPKVTGLSGGRFVVTWTDASPVGDSSFASIKAQIFDATGTRVGSEFLVNTQVTLDQAWSEVTRLTNGGFVITWFDFVGTRIKAQIYDTNGVRVGDELAVSSNPTGTQRFSVAAGLADGGFVIAWEDESQPLGDNSSTSVAARFYDATGAVMGSERLINTTTLGAQQQVDIAVLTGGGFVMAWSDGSTGDVRAQLFDINRERVGGEFLVNTETLHFQGDPSIAATPDGGFVITWTDSSSGGGDTGIKAQHFDSAGAKVGAEFQVNTNTFLNQVQPSAAPLPDGSFVVVWTDHSFTLGDTSNSSVKAQIFHQVASSGDDSFVAPLGNTSFDGLGGIDTITFGFRLVDAHVSYVGNTVVIDGPSSHTVLTGFEKYVFTDGTVNNNDGDVLVDDLFYYSHNHDVWNAHTDADAHYHSVGWKEGRDPDAFFSTTLYRALYADVKAANVDPLRHFDQSGWKEGRLPSADFDPAAYLAANPDVKAGGGDPLAHFLAHGAEEGRQPFAAAHPIGPRGFDYVYYLQTNPDVTAAGADPLQHFNQFGWKEGRNPNAYFDTKGYLDTYTDVKAANVNPLDHYNQFGWHEGRDPSVGFDTTSYLSSYPDVNAANVNPLVHFLQSGIHEGRSSFSDGVWG